MAPIEPSRAISATAYTSPAKPAGKGEQPPMPPMPSESQETSGTCVQAKIKPPNIPLFNMRQFEEIPIASEDVRITFLVENKRMFDAPEETGKLLAIADLIRQLNPYVHGEPVLKVRILDTNVFRGEYVTSMNEIVLSKSVLCDADFLHTIAHEMGHAVECSMKKDKEILDKLFPYSLGFGRYGLVADFNYARTGGYYGHPFRNRSELFASTFAAFVLHPDELVGCINDPGFLESTGLMGKALYCYMRDRVFGGRCFSKEDPFKTYNADKLAASITEQDIDLGLAAALHDHTQCMNNISVAQKAAEILFCKAMKDDRYFSLIAASTKDKDRLLRHVMLMVVGNSGVKDERLNKLIIDACHDKDVFIRAYAESICESRGIMIKKKILPSFLDGMF